MEWGKLIIVQAVSLALALALLYVLYKVLNPKGSTCGCKGGVKQLAGGAGAAEVVADYQYTPWQ